MIAHDPSLKVELKQFFVIGFPLAAAYLAEFAMFVTTKLVVGKLGYHSLAAVGISGGLSFEILVVLMALLSIVGVLAAQAHGAQKSSELGQSIRQGLFVATAIGIPAMLMIWNLDAVLIATEQDPKVVALATEYLHGLSGIVLPTLWFAVFRNFVAVLSQTVSIMVISVTAVVLNYIFTLWFVYGGFGLNPMGLFGAGLATSIVSWLMFFALTLHVFRKPLFRGFGIFKGQWQLHWPICRQILWLGLPVAGLAVLESGLFAATSILSGVIGAKTLAAYEIVAAWIGIPFVIAFGLAEATMITVAHAIGRDSMRAARRAGFLGMTLAFALILSMVIIPIIFAQPIILIFISPQDPGFTEVAALATHFLFIAALFMVFDALQAVSTRALRGMNDNLMPLWIAGFGYWVLGVGGGSILAFHYNWGGAGLWWGLAIGLAFASCLLTWRFHRLTLSR